MTFAPPTIRAAAAYYVAQGGTNLGIVGDTAHLAKGTSYHLGKDDLLAGAYSTRTARDKAGLTNAASAFDMGRLDGTLPKLYTFSRWFAQQCYDGKSGYHDVREVIFWSTTRQRVIGWSSLAPTQWINDYGDLSHKTHTHISFYRDSEFRDKVAMFRPYFEQEAPAVTALIVFATPQVAAVPTGTWIYDNESCAASAGNVQVSPGRSMPVAGKLASGTISVGYVDSTPTETELKQFWAKSGTVTLKAASTPPPPDATPYSGADLDAARAAGKAEGATTAATTERDRIADAERDRIAAI